MRTYLGKVVEWAAQRIIVRAIGRASEILDHALDDTPKQLPSIHLPELEFHPK